MAVVAVVLGVVIVLARFLFICLLDLAVGAAAVLRLLLVKARKECRTLPTRGAFKGQKF